MNKSTGWIAGTLGALVLLFGLGCLNYTRIGTVEHHSRFAAERGVPTPSGQIAYLGMLFAPLGAGVLGFSIGRRRSAKLP